jgi:hypothetical protein
MGREKEFSCETHAAAAITAMFFQDQGIGGARQASIPMNWDGLGGVLPLLTDFVVGAPTSGYLAILFLNVLERAPEARWAPYLLDALVAWVAAYGADTSFWVARGVGTQACAWLNKALSAGDGLALSAEHLTHLVGALDVLVKSGVAAARELEERFSADLLRRKRA